MERTDYFYWLCEMVCIDGRYSDQQYYHLAEILWNEEFYWSNPYDSDRAGDGLSLRDCYIYEGGHNEELPPSIICSVFEMLVALADRMEQSLDELDGECKTPIFFWQMIENLSLENFTDSVFEGSKNPDNLTRRVKKKLELWMDRRFDDDGEGGLFPLRSPRYDQRTVDFWYQANAYILENYME